MATQAFTTTGAQTWTVPNGVTSIQIECYGGGGGSQSAGARSDGGGGGGYGKVTTLSVTPGQTIYINVGAGGTVGGAGGNSWVNKTTNAQPTSTTDGCAATGGAAGNGLTTPQGGSGIVSNVTYSGGNSALSK